MATTATDLMDRAQHILVDLRHTEDPINRGQWESFDQTVYRLLHELDGAVNGWLSPGRSGITLHQILRDYPQPLQHVDDGADFSIREAAQLLGTSYELLRKRIWDGTLLAAHTGIGYRIPRSEVTRRGGITPAATGDLHPIGRLSCVIGA